MKADKMTQVLMFVDGVRRVNMALQECAFPR